MDIVLKRLALLLDKCAKNHCQYLSHFQSLEVPQRIFLSLPHLPLHLFPS